MWSQRSTNFSEGKTDLGEFFGIKKESSRDPTPVSPISLRSGLVLILKRATDFVWSISALQIKYFLGEGEALPNFPLTGSRSKAVHRETLTHAKIPRKQKTDK